MDGGGQQVRDVQRRRDLPAGHPPRARLGPQAGCLLGQMYMGQNDSPWSAIDKVLAEIPSEAVIRVVDFHAEASSEKIAMGYHLNGRVSIVFGTHTHIPTADARVLDKGTAYISDVGMTGPYDSVLGRRKDRVLSALTTSMPAHFEIAMGDPRLCGVLASVDTTSGKAMSPPSTGRATTGASTPSPAAQ